MNFNRSKRIRKFTELKRISKKDLNPLEQIAFYSIMTKNKSWLHKVYTTGGQILAWKN